MNPDARLRRALAPVDPPEGFAHRVRLRAAEAAAVAPARTRPAARRPVARWAAVAASVLAVLAGPLAWREYEARRDALAARAKVMLALQIASRELNTVHRHVVRPLDEPAERGTPADVAGTGKEGRP